MYLIFDFDLNVNQRGRLVNVLNYFYKKDHTLLAYYNGFKVKEPYIYIDPIKFCKDVLPRLANISKWVNLEKLKELETEKKRNIF